MFVPLPPDVVEAQERMQKAEQELRADLESGGPAHSEQRFRLLDNLKKATDEFLEKIARLGD